MKRGRWSAQDETRLRELYPCTRTDLLPALLDRSMSSIKNRIAALHLRKDPAASMRRRWTPDEDALLRELYPNTKTATIARQLRRTLTTTYGRARKLGLEKTEAYLASPDACRLRRGENPGAPYRFPKGHVPANKGLRRPGYAPGRMRETQFQKGVATKWMPVGSERLVGGYRYTKVSDIRLVPWTRNWVATHILAWEKEHGPLNRRTHALWFKNRDRLDVRLENLELITRAELARRNSIHNLPKELVHAYQLIGAVNRKINRRRRNEEQDRRSA